MKETDNAFTIFLVIFFFEQVTSDSSEPFFFFLVSEAAAARGAAGLGGAERRQSLNFSSPDAFLGRVEIVTNFSLKRPQSLRYAPASVSQTHTAEHSRSEMHTRIRFAECLVLSVRSRRLSHTKLSYLLLSNELLCTNINSYQ